MSDQPLLLEELTKAITYHFRKDKTKPGITISYLGDSYYVNVIRYCPDKKVVVSATANQMEWAIEGACKQFLSLISKPKDKTPVEILKESMQHIICRDYSNEETKKTSSQVETTYPSYRELYPDYYDYYDDLKDIDESLL